VKSSGAILDTISVVLTDVSTTSSVPSNESCSTNLKLINIGYHAIDKFAFYNPKLVNEIYESVYSTVRPLHIYQPLKERG
jgi:hypothetical protein